MQSQKSPPRSGFLAVYPTQPFVVMPDLQVIQQLQQAFKGLETIAAAAQAGFLSTSSDNFQCLLLFYIYWDIFLFEDVTITAKLHYII